MLPLPRVDDFEENLGLMAIDNLVGPAEFFAENFDQFRNTVKQVQPAVESAWQGAGLLIYVPFFRLWPELSYAQNWTL